MDLCIVAGIAARGRMQKVAQNGLVSTLSVAKSLVGLVRRLERRSGNEVKVRNRRLGRGGSHQEKRSGSRKVVPGAMEGKMKRDRARAW